MEFSPTYKRIFRTDEERSEDLDQIMEFKSKGWTWAEITDGLNDRPGVGYMVTQREIRQQYHSFIKENTDIIDTELERMSILDDLDKIYQMAYEAYMNSLTSTAELRTHTRPGKDLQEELVKKIKKQKEGKGNNAFLGTMIKVIETRAKILNITGDINIYTPANIPEVETPKGLQAPIRSEEQLLEMYEEIKRAN